MFISNTKEYTKTERLEDLNLRQFVRDNEIMQDLENPEEATESQEIARELVMI